uniref:Phospholipid-transporting ATPase n=1 Tax=Cacopsylla melanoneura TaxID=428564 RepID=A0A8D8M529_9HEMI
MSTPQKMKSGTENIPMLSTPESSRRLIDGQGTGAQSNGGGSGGARGVDSVDCITGKLDHRVININAPQGTKFVGNKISTAKYTLVTFVPCFLFEQFRRYSNIFFLFIALLQQIPDVSPTGRYTTLIPLILIMVVSGIKEIIEDIKRHLADGEINHRSVDVLKNGLTYVEQWKDLNVGDIVKVYDNSFFPADLLVLSTSENEGMCYIETMNLDGETNLKVRQALSETSSLTDPSTLSQLRGQIECDHPNRFIYEFTGNFKERGRPAVPLGPERILLRGSMLRNTAWIIGLVVYTGPDSKLMKNATAAPLKRSTVDKITNTQTIMLFVLLLALCFISAAGNTIWTLGRPLGGDWYLSPHSPSFHSNLLTFIILYNNLIPISLQVTLEIVRFVQATFINNDIDMYYEPTDTPAAARTSNLNEELGMVKFVFSDKTGTLTRNVMEFKICSVAGGIMEPNFNSNNVDEQKRMVGRNPKTEPVIHEFLTMLAVCHTVIPETKQGKINYHASSPDEKALILGACAFGYVFTSRHYKEIEINALGDSQRYTVLNVLEFTSDRKRMSLIVRTPKNEIKVFCKGADNVILARLEPNSKHVEETKLHLDQFASAGYRTLCFGVATLTEQKYKNWQALYQQAATAMVNREEKIAEVCELIETGLSLLGASAVEDKLQDYVPETIAALIKAKINVWVLTGDKKETAINIGYSSRLIGHDTPLLDLDGTSLDTVRESLQQHRTKLVSLLGTTDNNYAIIIDGLALNYALTHELRKDFLELCLTCNAVICCRVSPLQKAEVVELVTINTKCVTLAIGDGANDVAMIQKAHVGVGISGVEGLQAACASDYSIGQFRFLLKLLFVHGSWNYNRICLLILYSFYKNICLYVMELWFAIYSGWSGQVLFERWTIGMYNVLFTAFPPFAIGILDQVCSARTRLKYPLLYSQTDNTFNVKVFWIWIANAIFHSVLMFWIPMIIYGEGIIWSSGKDGGYLVLGNIVYTVTVIVVCIKAGLHIRCWTYLTHLSIWGSILLWFSVLVLYSFAWPTLPLGNPMVGMYQLMFSSLVFWLSAVTVPVFTLMLDVSFVVIYKAFYKNVLDMFRENDIRRLDMQTIISHEESSRTF